MRRSKRMNFFKIDIKKVMAMLLLGVEIMGAGGGLFGLISPVSAASVSLTQRLDWEEGALSGAEQDSDNGSLKLEADGDWVARDLHQPFYSLGWGASSTTDGTDIYMITGNGENKFLRYQPTKDTWKQMADLPSGVYMGGELLYLNEYIYAIPAGYQKKFYRYNISADSWTVLSDLPDLADYGASMTTDGTDIFATRGNNTDMLFYDVSEGSWSYMAAWPRSMRDADLVYDNGYIYGCDTRSPNYFYRYEVSTETTTRMANLPARRLYDTDATIYDGYIYLLRGYNQDDFWRYEISTNTWEVLSDTPTATYYGGGVVEVGGELYVYRGAGQYHFWKYDIASNAFTGIVDIPVTPGAGSDMVRHGSDIYMARGSNTTTFYKFTPDSEEGSWAQMANAPGTLYRHARGVAAGAYLYFYRAYNSTDFYRYNVAGDSWDTMTDAPATIYFGAGLGYPGSGDYIYGTRGSGTSTVYRYSISGDSWDDGAAADLPGGVYVYRGSGMVSDGTDLYLTPGFGQSYFYKYDVSENSWGALTDLPFAPYSGADIAYDGAGKIYASEGNWDKGFWEYTISTDSWRRLKRVPSIYGYQRSVGDGSSLEFDASGNLYTVRGSLNQMLKYEVGSSVYEDSGSWISDVQDLTYVDSFDSISVSSSTPSDSSLTVQTRSSSDMISWTGWETITGSTINSAVNRYLQIKVIFAVSTDRTVSPILSEVTISYTGDEVDPTNPDTITGSSQTVGGVDLTSGTTYSYGHPYFSWSGASDSETSVSGYYVYFGTSSIADPEVAGGWQTGSNYEVTEGLEAGSYYLRIKTKDGSGNISSTWSAFVYVYTGVPGEQSLVFDETSEFTGSTSSASILGDQIKLDSEAGGIWMQNRLSLAPAGLRYGAHSSAYVESSGKFYIFRGQNDTPFYEYDVTSDVWSTKATAPSGVYIGGGVVEGPSGYLYGFKGYNTNSVWRYDIAADEWSDGDAADAPNALYYGASMIYDGERYIYVLRGNNTDDFWRYDTFDDIWEIEVSVVDFGQPADAVNNNVSYGGDLTYDGSDTIFATQGGQRDGFASYSVVSDEWTVLPDVPQLAYLDASITYDSVTNAVYYAPAYSREDFYKYDISTQEWTQLTDVPGRMYYGSEMRVVGDYIYAFRGGNGRELYRYKISAGSWQVPTRGLFGVEFVGTDYDGVTTGGSVCKGSGNLIYATRGGMGNDFVSYDTSSGVTVKLDSVPSGGYYGASIEYDSTNSKVYYHPGYLRNKFYIYDVATDEWSEEGDDPPLALRHGSDMVYDGSRYVYATRAGGSSTFYRFDTQGSPGSKWDTMSNVSQTVYMGSDMVYKNGYIYATRGYNTANNPFYRYEVATDTWDNGAVADMPIDVYYGGFLVDGEDGNLYAARGENDTEFYQYSIAGDVWTQMTDVPAQVYYGADAVGDGSGKIYALAASGTNTFNDGFYTYVQPTSTTGFEVSGTYTSETHDLLATYRFANLKLDLSLATGTDLGIQTRSSADDSTWSSFTAVSQEKINGSTYEYKINSPSARYLQVKFSLSSDDGQYSPIISSYTINYFQDSLDPVNPTSITGYSTATKSAEITTEDWNLFTAPLFEWPVAELAGGATDTATGSAVVGYYVYYGVNSEVDAEDEGTYQTGNSYTAGSMSSGSTYYLRVKTKDDAGNVSDDDWVAFIYKFDSVNPTNPQTVTVDPPGYSATNSFDFAWSGATDSASGVVEYCYKTGEVGSGETCTSEASVSGIASYQTGTNVFYVRSKDDADNLPTEYSTASYYYSSTAPSPVQNLAVTPESNEANEFAFSWSAPSSYYGAQSGLLYYYSINNLPTANNVNEVGLSNSYLPAGAYATQQGVNYFYVVAKDEAGNIDYDLYSRVLFTADTTAPGIARDMEIADVSIKATESWKLAITWDAPESSGSSGISDYEIYRSIAEDADCTSDFTDFSSVATTTSNSYVDTNLDEEYYYYCVKACDSTDNCSAVSDTVNKYPDGRWLVAATLTASPSASVKTKSAAITWSTSRTSNSFVSYGTESGSYGEEVGSSTHLTAHDVELEGLDPGTTYYYLVKWTDEDGNLGESDEYNFTTEPAPLISNVKTADVGLYSAYVTFTIANATKASVQYGETLSYGSIEEIATSKSEGTYTVKIDNLEDGTEYHFRVIGEDEEANEFIGDDYVLETLPVPEVSGLRIQQVVGMPTATVRLLWGSNTELSSVVTYYPTANPERTKDSISLGLKSSHEVILRDLMDNADYTLVVKGRDVAGNEAKSLTKSLKTASDIRAPEIENMEVETTITGVGEEAKAQVIVTWDTDEPGSTQVEFGEGTGASYGSTTQEDGNLTENHTVIITDLLPAKVYHLRAVSKDKSENVGISFDSVVITPKATKSAFNLVIDNLSATFGFLGGLSTQ